jgi:hypothetical protein
LLSMQHCVDLMFTKGEDPVTINLIYWYILLPVKKGEERLSEHEIVYMSLQQFDIYRSEGSKWITLV